MVFLCQLGDGWFGYLCHFLGLWMVQVLKPLSLAFHYLGLCVVLQPPAFHYLQSLLGAVGGVGQGGAGTDGGAGEDWVGADGGRVQ